MKRVGIMTICCLFLFTATAQGKETREDYEVLYSIEDNRYDIEEGKDETINLGIFKQWLAAILLVEHSRDLKKEMLVVYEDVSNEQITPVFQLGQTISENDALHALVKFPAEDIYQSCAYYLLESKSDFTQMMEEKITSLGMTNTSLSQNYTTMHDIQILLSYCWSNETIRSAMQEKMVKATTNMLLVNDFWRKRNVEELQYVFENNNTTAFIFELKGQSFLSMQNKTIDIQQTIEHNQKKYVNQELLKEGTQLGSVTFKGTFIPYSLSVTSKQERAVIPYSITDDQIDYEFIAEENLDLPVHSGTLLGNVVISSNENIIKEIPIYAEKEIYNYYTYLIMACILCGIGLFEFRRRKKRYE